jgi:uroporphyrinogen decarboxylase
MTLSQLTQKLDRSPVIPLMGYPGVALNGTNVKQNLFNHKTHFHTLDQLIKRFELDGIFFFMDLTLEAGAFGLPVDFPTTDVPTVTHHPVKSWEDIQKLAKIDILSDARVNSFIETMHLMKSSIDTVNAGYITGPFTLAGLLMGASEIAIGTLTQEQLVKDILSFCTENIIKYATALHKAGADAIAILEPTAMIVSPEQFFPFSGEYINQITAECEVDMILHICGDTNHLIKEMLRTNVSGFSLDYMMDFATLKASIPEDFFLIGNIEPVGVIKELDVPAVQEAVLSLKSDMQDRKNFIISTGCDLPVDTPLENIQAFVETAKSK